MDRRPLWKLTKGGIEYNHDMWFGYYDSWDKFVAAAPWDCNALSGTIPTFWKVYHPEDSDYDEEYDTPSLGLVYTSLVPLRAYSIEVELDPNTDTTPIEEWLIEHGFLVLGG